MPSLSRTPIARRSPGEVFEHLLIVYAELLFNEKFPTNAQIISAMNNIITQSPINRPEVFDKLSDEGQLFWRCVMDWIDALQQILLEKNQQDRFQFILSYCQAAVLTNEEGASKKLGSQISYGLLLLLTSTTLQNVLVDSVDFITGVFRFDPQLLQEEMHHQQQQPPPQQPSSYEPPSSSAAARRQSYYQTNFPETSHPMQEGKGRESLMPRSSMMGGDPWDRKSGEGGRGGGGAFTFERPIYGNERDSQIQQFRPSHEYEMKDMRAAARSAEPHSDNPVRKGKDVGDEIAKESTSDESQPLIPSDKQSSGQQEGDKTKAEPSSPEKANPSRDPSNDQAPSSANYPPPPPPATIPFDSSPYYTNSYPRPSGHNYLEENEKRLAKDFIRLLESILAYPQISGLPQALIYHIRKALAKKSHQPKSHFPARPYISNIIVELKNLCCSNFPLSALERCLTFFEEKFNSEADLKELAFMTVDFVQRLLDDENYRKSDQAVYRAKTHIFQFREKVLFPYPEQTSCLVTQINLLLDSYLEERALQRFEGLSRILNEHLRNGERLNAVLLRDFFLVVLPEMGKEMNATLFPLTTFKLGKSWTLMIEKFCIPSSSFVPSHIDVAINHRFQLDSPNAQKVLAISLKKMNLSLSHVPYHLYKKGIFAFRDHGQARVTFREGVNIEIELQLEFPTSSSSQPDKKAFTSPSFKFISLLVNVHPLTLEKEEGSFPFNFRFYQKQVQIKLATRLEEKIKENLTSFIGFLQNFCSNLSYTCHRARQSYKADEDEDEGTALDQERVKRDIKKFCELFFPVEPLQEPYTRHQESSGSGMEEEPDTPTSAGDDATLGSDHTVLPWASSRFSF